MRKNSIARVLVFSETNLKDSLCSILPAKLVLSTSNRNTGPIANNIDAAPVPFRSLQRHYFGKHTYSSTQQLYGEILATGLALEPIDLIKLCVVVRPSVDL